ncbi:MAG: hypothetical protein ACRCYY_05700 [Trueperaceae bacterium]
MKKAKSKDDIKPYYDFSRAKPNPFAKAMQKGHTVKIRHADGSTTIQKFGPKDDVILLESDVREYFPDAEAVNKALRSLIELVPKKSKQKRG